MSNTSETCVICMEDIENEKPLLCGHIVHFECVKKQFKPECPICRAVIKNLKVSGTAPEAYIPYSHDTLYSENWTEDYYDENNDDAVQDDEAVQDSNNPIYHDIEKWRQMGYSYREEHPDYDEENPDEDEVDYD